MVMLLLDKRTLLLHADRHLICEHILPVGHDEFRLRPFNPPESMPSGK
jgi:hypothetical protein